MPGLKSLSLGLFRCVARRIREIRTSEKRFYQKVRDLYATAIDYDPKNEQAQIFFKKVQNKMLWAATHHTASELIVEKIKFSKA